jgi:signal transduction histidine kinase
MTLLRANPPIGFLFRVILGIPGRSLIRADDPQWKSIQTIDGTAQRAGQLTRQLLAFSRKQVLAPTVLDLNQVIGDLTDMLHRLIGEAIELTVTPAAAGDIPNTLAVSAAPPRRRDQT